MSDKNFIKGWAKQVSTQYWDLFNIRINVNQLNKLPTDDEWYVQITMMKIKEPKEKGYTHYFVENTYKKWETKQETKGEDSDLPF